MLSDSPNHQPRDSRISESTHGSANRQLRTSLEMVFQDSQLHNADASASAHRELRTALRQVCTDARRSGLRVEQLLVLIKEVWSGIPAGISRVKSMHGDERLNYVISTCVDEYYGDDGSDKPNEREVSP
jgi:hypothetical protein